MSLTETLAANGYTHTKAGEHGAHAIYHGSKRIFVGTAPQVWEWLRMLSVMAH